MLVHLMSSRNRGSEVVEEAGQEARQLLSVAAEVALGVLLRIAAVEVEEAVAPQHCSREVEVAGEVLRMTDVEAVVGRCLLREEEERAASLRAVEVVGSSPAPLEVAVEELPQV